MKTVAIVQARMGSSRLPGKVMKTVAGQRVIDLLLHRLKQASGVDEIVLATTHLQGDDPLAAHCATQGIRVVRDSEDDVLQRYVRAAEESGADVVVRITGDCPFVMPELVDAAISAFHAQNGDIDYLSNIDPPTYPDGLDIEVFTAASLLRAAHKAQNSHDREHVTPFLRRAADIRRGSITAGRDLSALRLTIDEPVDLQVAEAVLQALSADPDFDFAKLIALYDSQPELFEANSTIARNEGAKIGKGQKLWKRAKQVIPGGNMLLSKRAEMHLPEQWPAYFDRTQGCRVWDMDGAEYIDAGFMGIGTNVLGYSHPEVDDAVRDCVAKGNLSTLNAPEEVLLAERLVEINAPWADMVRFARSGGEANAIAVRIARAASGRDGVAICGYHGWHDWYLSANLADDANLDGHLLPGLSPRGVPRSLAASTFPFMYNDFAALEELVATGKIGVIKMEVVRNAEPQDDFLHKVRALADANGIVLVFDECTSGFRETFGGLHKKYGVEPDIAVFGKTLGNGYAITAVVGRRAVMEAAQSTFISSTFWTERIGSVAALKTLEIMEREESWMQITDIGNDYRSRLRQVAASHNVDVVISGLPALTTWSVTGDNPAGYKTLVTQEMLKRGFLAPPAFYASLAHTPEVLDLTFAALDDAMALVSKCQTGRETLEGLLDGPICHTGFNRLN
ncbi:aminotransferase class III-fold pyridoxal phosphate-dependent enzyme [Roseobacter sp. CCS2]|uniref:aminotransferase class III-fold pyridoxal phosphate-dependent enzyme n=1 Tax=Roseobacter sp. CCS2 TaxID=391593 RepID=UPI0000F401A3|nr:aminotransferase class III-fold pyridoxal phosphate-dependent enzyme [Roseobacter sp. CCS2]EBA13976.1 Acylneuraminate cytidylyltransferase:Aminotransferase class-III [Roseobacter sp. CCS2]